MKEIFIIRNHYKNDSHQDEKEIDIKKTKISYKKTYKTKTFSSWKFI